MGRGTLWRGDSHPESGEPMKDSLGCIMGLPTMPVLSCTQGTSLISLSKGLALPSVAAAGSPEGGSLSFPHRPAVSLEPLMFTLFFPKFKRSSQPCTPSQS